ncbi:MAG: relaxase/mobilization nuclease domain-containing protein [Alphaproteobacteria bacterium]|nr:relaxase/mobilization nuclease domain-containing protein [Alphaproteobacteria bacterium]
MIPRVAKLGTGFVGAGLYYMHDKRDEGLSAAEAKRPSAAEYFLSDKGPAQTAKRVGFTATRNLATDDPMKALRQMAFTAGHAHEIRVNAVTAAAKAAGMSYDAYVREANPFRGRKGEKPVYTLSLAWQPGDVTATKETMLKAADEVRHVLGLQDHQCVIIEHTDTKHPHAHLIFNRVHPATGKYASVANDRLKLSQWALDWEKRHGRVVCPAREPNHQQREENRVRKVEARVRGEPRAKSGYVKNKGLPPSEIEFWMKHGNANLTAVRAARADYQKQDHETHQRVTARKLADVDLHHERANGRTLDRIERTLKVLTRQPPARREKKPASLLDVVFGAVRGAALGIVARIANRTDIAKLEKIKTQLRRERDIRRAEVIADRRRAYQKMERIHAWQNWLDEKRCRSYRDSDTRDWRARCDRWDLAKIKPPLFGTVDVTFYDVAESRDARQALDDRRKLLQPIEMKPIVPEQNNRAPNPQLPSPQLPGAPSQNKLPFVKRDPEKHAAEVADRAKQRMAERGERTREQGRASGRKRRPRPR